MTPALLCVAASALLLDVRVSSVPPRAAVRLQVSSHDIAGSGKAVHQHPDVGAAATGVKDILTRSDNAEQSLRASLKLAEEKIAEAEAKDAAGAGLVVAAKNDYQMLSQWLVISNRAQEQLLKYLTEFGMTPSARSRVAAAAKQGSLFPEDDPIAAARRAGGKAPA